jgi:2-(1,2-epoxy-1,2-dihydrophenyl)acetyl-CoA isomerase
LADGVLLVTLTDPERRNALSAEVKRDLAAALQAARAKEVRAVVLTGAGRAFCAGGDVSAMEGGLSSPAATRARILDAHSSITIPLMELEKPTIAVVNGVAAGAGIGLALACDLRITAHSAKFVLAFSGIGLVPDMAVGYLLPRAIGLARAKELALLRRAVTSEQAADWGLTHEVVDDESCLSRGVQVARELACGPTTALGLTKRLFDIGQDLTFRDFLATEAAFQAMAAATEDHVGARTAFLQKTTPVFNGQ